MENAVITSCPLQNVFGSNLWRKKTFAEQFVLLGTQFVSPQCFAEFSVQLI